MRSRKAKPMKHVRISNKRNNRISLSILFTGAVFIFTSLTVIVAEIIFTILSNVGVLKSSTLTLSSLLFIVLMASTLFGTVAAFFISRFPLHPINSFVDHMNQLASGDFKTRISMSKPWSELSGLKEVQESFNKTAEELGNTEVLRNDFINNFSHEFKTPIVSIAGFAKLLRKGNLSEEQTDEYLKIIEEESLRLSYMATNVLNLTKVENREILTDTTRYNLSEQIRNCILLLEDKWSKKKLDLDLDFDEYEIVANEELLKEVWINLLDNAVKFSPEYGTIAVTIRREGKNLVATIRNNGSEIPKDKLDLIFKKFYQADESHSKEGNGVGLAIVRKVVDLHGGYVRVYSNPMETAFEVTVPRRI